MITVVQSMLTQIYLMFTNFMGFVTTCISLQNSGFNFLLPKPHLLVFINESL